MGEKNGNILSVLSFLFLAFFVCGVGSFNQLSNFATLKLSMIEVIIGVLCLMLSVIFKEHGDFYVKGLLKWLLPLFVIVFSGVLGKFAIDYFVYFIIFILYIQWGQNKSNVIFLFLKIIHIFGLIVFISVLIDYLYPAFFSNIYAMYPSEISTALYFLRNNNYTSGITIQPAYAALYIVISLGVTVYVLELDRFVKYPLITLSYVSLLLTGKRTSSVAILLAFALIYLIENKGNNQRFIKILRIGMVVYGLYLVLSFYSYFTFYESGIVRLFLLFENIVSGQDILSRRADLWQLSLNVFYKSPLIGAGWGTISSLTESWSGGVSALITHNIYIQLLAETGVIGTILFLFPFISEYVSNIKILNHQKIDYEDNKLLRFSVFWQSFFFIYGFTGNPIYDLCPLCIFCITVIMGSIVRNNIVVIESDGG